MRRSILSGIVAALSFALPLTAQEPRVEVPVIGETIDVRVVNVEAVVTSASGERVRDGHESRERAPLRRRERRPTPPRPDR
jgi:hypothetical protein